MSRPTTWARNQCRRAGAAESAGTVRGRAGVEGLAGVDGRQQGPGLGHQPGGREHRLGPDHGSRLGGPVVGVDQAVDVAAEAQPEVR